MSVTPVLMHTAMQHKPTGVKKSNITQLFRRSREAVQILRLVAGPDGAVPQ
jgi:hypothetical protein